MPFVLTTDNPTDGDAYWGPAGSGGLADWSEDGDGNLYPNNDATQDLGLPTNRVDRFFGVQTILSTGAGADPTVAVAAPGLVAQDLRDAGAGFGSPAVVREGGFTWARASGPASYLRNTTAGGFVSGVASSTAGGDAILGVGPGVGEGTSPAFAMGLASSTGAGAAELLAYNQSLAFGQVSTSGAASADLLANNSSMAFGSVGTGVISATGAGSFAGGRTLTGGVITATGLGAMAHGGSEGTGSLLRAQGVASLVQGLALGGGSVVSYVSAGAAIGYASSGGIVRSFGGLALGRAFYGTIQTIGQAGLAGGYAGYGALIQAQAGGFAFGSVSGGDLSAAAGALVFGRCFGADSGIVAQAGGGFAGGYSATAEIRSQSSGAFAFGAAQNGNGLTASGVGSLAFGRTSGADPAIVASAANSAQFFPGTNNLTNSLKVGADATGIRLIGDGVAGTRNGDFWCDGYDVFVRVGGFVRSLLNIPP